MSQPYITYRELNNEGLLCYYVLQKAFPHYVAIISYGKLEDSIYSEPVAGYNLWLNFNGCLRGRFMPSYKDVLEDIRICLMDMAIWFYNNRVAIEPKKYIKFKIPT